MDKRLNNEWNGDDEAEEEEEEDESKTNPPEGIRVNTKSPEHKKKF